VFTTAVQLETIYALWEDGQIQIVLVDELELKVSENIQFSGISVVDKGYTDPESEEPVVPGGGTESWRIWPPAAGKESRMPSSSNPTTGDVTSDSLPVRPLSGSS
jgi:hypothetical protein